jgi:hypothetical protein
MFIDNIAEKFIQNFFLNTIKPFGVLELKTAVSDNISLLDEAIKHNPGSISLAAKIAKQFSGQSNLLTTENVLKWISDKRNDLYFAFICNRNSYLWLDRNVREFREFLFK